MNIEDAFRQLRKAWFDAHIYLYAHERESESRSRTAEREAMNRRSRRLYDAQTEAIIRGEPAPVAPRCLNEIHKAKQPSPTKDTSP
jgi:hypothetical protein